MKHMTLYCHGSVPVELLEDEGYKYVDAKKVTIPENMSVVFYIPPGTIFNALSGVKLFNRIRNSYDMDKKETDKLVQAIESGMSSTVKSKDYSQMNKSFWVGQSDMSNYPRICTSSENNEFAYNYNLKGMKPTDPECLKMVSWGLHEGGFGGRVVKPLAPGSTSTLQEMITAASEFASAGDATVHCIFCRVEMLNDAAANFAAASMQTQSLNFVTISI